jgi:hypothetical protein
MWSRLHRQVSAEGHQQWRLTSRELVAIVAVAVLVASLAPRAVEAATSLMTISDVSNGQTARVDAGKLRVGDGTGPLTVDGTVYSRPLNAALPWFASENVSSAAFVPLPPGPVGAAVNVTSISSSALLSTAAAADLALYVGHVSSSETSCATTPIDATIWHIPSAPAAIPLAVAFPTPLTWRPPVGTRACLILRNYGGTVTFNASGFFGG